MAAIAARRRLTYVREEDGPLSLDKLVEADLAVRRLGLKVRDLVAEAEAGLLLGTHGVREGTKGFVWRCFWRRRTRTSSFQISRVRRAIRMNARAAHLLSEL